MQAALWRVAKCVRQTNKQHITIPRQWLSKCLTPLSSDAGFCNHWQHIKHQGGGGDKRERGEWGREGERGGGGGDYKERYSTGTEKRQHISENKSKDSGRSVKGGGNKRENGPEKLRGDGCGRMNDTMGVRLGKRIKSNSEGENTDGQYNKSMQGKKAWLTADTDRYCGNSLGIVMERNEMDDITGAGAHVRTPWIHNTKRDHKASKAQPQHVEISRSSARHLELCPVWIST